MTVENFPDGPKLAVSNFNFCDGVISPSGKALYFLSVLQIPVRKIHFRVGLFIVRHKNCYFLGGAKFPWRGDHGTV